MSSSVEPRDEYESPFPECRVTAATDPAALVRFDMPRERAVEWTETVQQAVDDHDGDGLVTLGLILEEATYVEFVKQVLTLVQHRDDELASAQVLTDPDLEPGDDGVGVGVLLNAEQLVGILETAQAGLAKSEGHSHRWEFSVSPTGAEMLVQQLIAACNGAEDPLQEVDPDE